MKNDFLSLVLAAGKGTRMMSFLPKVLHKINNKSMIFWVINSFVNLDIKKYFVVLGHEEEKIKNYISLSDEFKNIDLEKINFISQKTQLGTGDAVKISLKYLENYDGNILIISGDTPLIQRSTLNNLMKEHIESDADITLLTAIVPDPSSYGRIKKDENGNIMEIIEEKNASSSEKQIKEINSGIYAFKIKFLQKYLDFIKLNEITKEYYLTDLVKIAYQNNKKISNIILSNPDEIIGINDKFTLSIANQKMKYFTNKNFMLNGVILENPDTIEIDSSAEIGMDTVISEGTIIKENVKIGKNCQIGPFTFLKNTTIDDNVTIKYSYSVDACIGENSKIGPFAHIRPNSIINKNVKIGNFTEIKSSTIKNNSKVSHLSYIGDAILESDVNIGAGVITCNYDGKKKHKTKIGKGAFIGSNSNLIAPITIGNGAFIGAGSTVYKDVPDNSLSIERNEQINKINYLSKKTKNSKKQSND